MSADGTDIETFAKYRKGVDYAKVISGLEYLRDEKKIICRESPNVDFQIILMKHTQRQLEQARAFAKNLNARFLIKYLNLEMVNSADKEQFLPINKKYNMYTVKNNQVQLQRKMKNVPCVAWDGIVINWDGSVNPCLFDYYSSIVLGNIKETSITQIWRGKLLQNLRKRILRNKRSIGICRRCPINERYSELYYSL